MLIQWHRADFGNDDLGVSTNLVQPRAEFFCVRDGCAERDDFDVLGKVKDYLFPDGTAEAVGEVVHLIHDYITKVHERLRVRINHVSQDLGGHYDDLGIRVLVCVTGQ